MPVTWVEGCDRRDLSKADEHCVLRVAGRARTADGVQATNGVRTPDVARATGTWATERGSEGAKAHFPTGGSSRRGRGSAELAGGSSRRGRGPPPFVPAVLKLYAALSDMVVRGLSVAMVIEDDAKFHHGE